MLFRSQQTAPESVANMGNSYEILGVDPEATTEEITKAYKKLALKYHPDRAKQEAGEEKFEEVCQAYKLLTEGINPEGGEQEESVKSNMVSFSDMIGDLPPVKEGGEVLTRSASEQVPPVPVSTDLVRVNSDSLALTVFRRQNVLDKIGRAHV